MKKAGASFKLGNCKECPGGKTAEEYGGCFNYHKRQICLNSAYYKNFFDDCINGEQEDKTIKFVCGTIVHESIHSAILDLEGVEACKSYDLISDKVEFWRKWLNGFAQLSLS